jgi:hypothetical protein
MTNDTSKKITAKFSGKCTNCHGVVLSGTQCFWDKGAGVRHISCDNSVPHMSPTNTVAQSDSKQVTVTMGVFKKDGRIYVVKPNREKTRVYAKEIVESPARMTENGSVVDFEAIYRPGVVFNLTESDRWDLADAKDFLTKFSKCIVCGRSLKAAKSVASAIGPVCAKYFAHSKHDDACNHAAPKSQEVLDAEDALKARKIAKQIEIEDEGQLDEATETAIAEIRNAQPFDDRPMPFGC